MQGILLTGRSAENLHGAKKNEETLMSKLISLRDSRRGTSGQNILFFQRHHFMDFWASGLSAMCRPRNLESNAFIGVEIDEKDQIGRKIWEKSDLRRKIWVSDSL